MQVRNPRTGRVLKNPERFIKQLQFELESTQESVDYFNSQLEKAKGECVITWAAHNKIQRTVSSTVLFSLNPGDKIAIVVTVLNVKGSKCQAGNLESEIEYKVLETRRMPEDW